MFMNKFTRGKTDGRNYIGILGRVDSILCNCVDQKNDQIV